MIVKFTDEFRDDLLVGMEWLDERSLGLGDQLEAECFSSISTLEERPDSFAPDKNGYRPCRLKRFNAVLYFLFERDQILVIGLLVGGQDKSRLAGRRKR